MKSIPAYRNVWTGYNFDIMWSFNGRLGNKNPSVQPVALGNSMIIPLSCITVVYFCHLLFLEFLEVFTCSLTDAWFGPLPAMTPNKNGRLHIHEWASEPLCGGATLFSPVIRTYRLLHSVIQHIYLIIQWNSQTAVLESISLDTVITPYHVLVTPTKSIPLNLLIPSACKRYPIAPFI